MNPRDLGGGQHTYWSTGDISHHGGSKGIRFYEPVVTRAFDRPTGEPAAENEAPQVKIHFKPGDLAKEMPSAVLLAQIADQHFELTRTVPGPEQDQMRGAVEGIQQQYAEQTKIADHLEGRLGSPPDEADYKTATPSLASQLAELLRCQQYIEMAALFEGSAEQDEREAVKLTSLLEKLNDWYVDGIGEIRDELRTKREGLQWVRELLSSGSEILIDLGIRLAREPSIRAAVQQDLARIYKNVLLSVQIRHRAWAYMFLDVREDMTTRIVHRS
jgi:hypothetical protein